MENDFTVVQTIQMVMQWGVIPMVGFMVVLYKQQQNHATELAVLRALLDSAKESHDREFQEVRDSVKTIISKLSGIEEYLRR